MGKKRMLYLRVCHKECHSAPVVVLGNCLAARVRSEHGS